MRIEGTYSATIFRSDDNGFSVYRFKLRQVQEKTLIVTGYLPPLDADVLYELEGEYVEHPRFGMQFSVSSYRKELPQDADMIVRYLSSPGFPGIGVKLAQNIVDLYGSDILNEIKANPQLPLVVPGLSDKKKQILIAGITQQDDLDEAIAFFTTHGLSIRQVMAIDRVYGKEAITVLRHNPYRLIEDVDGIGFKTADKLALSLGFEMNDPLRLQAAMVAMVMQLNMNSGDTYTNRETLFSSLQKSLNEYEVDFTETLTQLLNEHRLVMVESRIYHLTQYEAEQTITGYYQHFPLEPMNLTTDLDEQLELTQTKYAIRYDELQLHAIRTFFQQDASIITGGPGTGKTTIILGIIDILKRCFPENTLLLCAPTGRAAKRLKELTHCDAQTIHSALHWDLETNSFGFNEKEPLMADIIILDEFSMVDSWLMAHLLLASRQVKKFLFLGDADQLPSVGPGFVIRDFITSGFFTVTSLLHIYRQKEGSDVITLAQSFKNGHFELNPQSRDVRFFPAGASQVKDIALSLINNALEKGYSIHEIQVLVPQYNGLAGIDQLNHFLQAACNPADVQKRELKVGYAIYREGDKILQLKNQPDDFVFNGDIGILVEIIFAAEDENHQNRIVVDFDSVIVEYTSETFINISHAYCMSVHKAQGSEYPIVIVVALRQYRHMLQRRLYYTAFTRASKALILIGEDAAFESAAQNNRSIERKTHLREDLKLLDNVL